MKSYKKASKKKTSKRLNKQRTGSITQRINKTIKKPQNHFAELAPLIEICYTDLITGKKLKHKFPRRKDKFNEDTWVLLWNTESKELWGVKRGRTLDITEEIHKTIDPKTTKAYKLYKDFNGWEQPNISLTSITKPFNWEEVGKAEHVVYHSDKWEQSDFYDYIHPFGDNGHIQIRDHGVKFYYDRKNKIFRICGGKLTVNDRGIVY